MKQLPTVWALPIIAGLPSLWIVCCKGYFETTAKLTYLGSKFNWIEMFFRQICQLAFVACVHFWLNQKLFNKFNIPTIFGNLFFYGIYFEIFGFGLYDFEYARINMQMVLPSILTAYVGRVGVDTKLFTEPLYNIPNSGVEAVVAKSIIIDSIMDQPAFWISTIVFVILWIILQLVLVFVNRDLVIMSAQFRSNNFRKKQIFFSSAEYRNRFWVPQNQYKNPAFITAHVLGGIHVLFLIRTFLIPSDFKMARFSFLPYLESIFLAFSHFEKSLSPKTKKNFLNITRGYLPPGRRWLDNRENPTFPAVHGDMQAFCAYNKGHKDCQGFVPPEQKPLVKKLPNVAFLVYESLTPSYYFITKDFIREHTSISDDDPHRLITSTPFYNKDIVKNLARYQKYGIAFSGMTSLGIPTASGWHGLMTGLAPSQSYGNMIDGAYMHSDDLPSAMRMDGYRSFYISASLFNFDGTRFWVWRRPAEEEAQQRLHCEEGFGDLIDDKKQRELIGESRFPKLKKCKEEDVKRLAKELKKKRLDFPKWFDYAFSYTPSRENAKAVGIDPETLRLDSSWPSDRLTSAEFITHWQQQKDILNRTKQDKPIFGGYLSIESHIPYYGYDKPEYYEDQINESIKKDIEMWREKRFIRVNKYADHYQVGEVLDWLKKNDPNTIFVITGDHGTRDVPIREQDSPIFDDVVYSSDCVHHSSGIDSFFVTSGMIGYLGDDPEVKKVMGLDKLAGKTIKVPTDHNDLVFTVEDILAKLNGTSMQPTHRRNRNLVDLGINITNTVKNQGGVKKALKDIDDSRYASFSMTSFNTEYREGTKMFRSHPADPSGSHYYEHASYPMCLRKKSNPPMKLGVKEGLAMYDRMFRHIQSETYLMYHNRLYNYAFRDNQCIEKGSCEFPKPEPLIFNDGFFFGCLVLVPVAFMVLIGGVVALSAFILNMIESVRNDEEILHDENYDNTKYQICQDVHDDTTSIVDYPSGSEAEL